MKGTIVGIIIILLAGMGWFLFSKNTNTKPVMNVGEEKSMNKTESESTSMEKVDETVMVEKTDTVKSESVMVKNGSYEVYSPEKLAKANTGKVILFFKASWCPTCRTLDSDIKNNLSNIPENITILEVDYDNSSTLKIKYGVTTQHTLVQVDADGKLISKWIGSSNLSNLVNQIK